MGWYLLDYPPRSAKTVMAFGILEDDHLSEVPGTGILSDHGVVHGNEIAINEAANLKRGTGRHAHIVLMPQPSDDPRDPLNWPTWKKEGCFWTLAFVASLDGALSPLVSAGYVVLAQQFDISVDDVTSTFGTILLGLATFMLFQGALAEKWGHRIVYLGSVFLMFISCIWCAASPSLGSIRASRVFQGFGMSAFQSLTANTIEQVYLGPLVCSYVIENLSWQWGFWIVSIPLGISVLLVFFLVPETTFHRLPATIADDKSSEQAEKASDAEKSPTSIGEAPAYDSSVTQPQRPSYRSELKIWNGSFSKQSFWRIFLRPIPFIFSPVALFLSAPPRSLPSNMGLPHLKSA
ncbi:hypothetical protein NLI96_g11318 [Meripilus lineatus]|uniref:Major facilitator superfamily (MFS) profile domain-containing protein n=1 Tax=Meripilus lineatus TaxID=2056292 RepID=A0AAD5YDH5_9APHY|nr:hypothetical protein NLI96_g11318 [Physisporinus lineatus]